LPRSCCPFSAIRVVAEHLIEQGHEVKMAASGRALPYLREHLPDVEEIWGLAFALEHGEVEARKTLIVNVRGSVHGVPEDWREGAGSRPARSCARRFRAQIGI
jgi:Glycosyl transferase family 1